jgi:hypothetical protein
MDVMAASETTYAVRGLVHADGEIRGGHGFSLTRTGAGRYTVGFLEPFDDPPVVIATPSSPGRIATVATSRAGADVTLTDLHGSPADTGFGFSAEPLTPG